MPNVFAWYCLCHNFTPAVRANWAATAPAKPEKKKDNKKAEVEKKDDSKEQGIKLLIKAGQDKLLKEIYTWSADKRD